jgi:hypothetical protein
VVGHRIRRDRYAPVARGCPRGSISHPEARSCEDVRYAASPDVSWHLLFGYAGGDGTDGAVSLKSMLRPEAQAQANDVLGSQSHRSILRSPESVRAVNEHLHCSSGVRSTR